MNDDEAAQIADRRRLCEAGYALADTPQRPLLAPRDVSRAAGLPLARAYRSVPDKPSLLAALLLPESPGSEATFPEDEHSSIRDRLFERIMGAFDELQNHRETAQALIRDIIADPASALVLAPGVLARLQCVAHGAGAVDHGSRGVLTSLLLAGVWLQSLRGWMADSSADLARTMAAVDGGLRKVEPYMPHAVASQAGHPLIRLLTAWRPGTQTPAGKESATGRGEGQHSAERFKGVG